VLHLEVDGAPEVDERVRLALENLREFASEVVVLGSYPRYIVGANAPRVHGVIGM